MKIILFLASWFLILNASTLHAQKSVDKNHDKIFQAIREGNQNKAIELCNKILKKDPLNVFALGNKAVSLSNLGEYAKSNIYLITLDSIQPNNKVTNFLIAENFVNLGKHDSAITRYESCLALGYEPDVRLYFNLGSAHYFTNDNQKAVFYLNKGIALDSNFQPLYNNLAWASLDSNPSYSCKLFNKAYLLDVNNSVSINNLGYAHLLCNNLDTALKYFNMSLKLDPNNSFVYRNIGLYHMHKGNKSQSCEYMQKAIDFGIITKWGEKYIEELRKYCI